MAVIGNGSTVPAKLSNPGVNIFFALSNAVAGESALDRIACGLGGKIVLPMIKQHIMQMLQNRKYACVNAHTFIYTHVD